MAPGRAIRRAMTAKARCIAYAHPTAWKTRAIAEGVAVEKYPQMRCRRPELLALPVVIAKASRAMPGD